MGDLVVEGGGMGEGGHLYCRVKDEGFHRGTGMWIRVIQNISWDMDYRMLRIQGHDSLGGFFKDEHPDLLQHMI